MRLIILALLLALAFSTAQAYPLQGSDGTATVTLFGAVRAPLNDTSEILKVDIGLMGTENATYELLDADDRVYKPGLYKTLTPERQLVYFIIPKDDLFKLLTALPSDGKAININWWATPKKSNNDLVIRYYGITDWLINPDEQGIVLQVRAQNNGTHDLLVSPENFTLLDQWGWPYSPTAGFDSENVGPQNATERVLLGFTGIPILSKPAALAYDYNGANQILIDFDKDYAPLPDATVYGPNATKSTATAQPAPASLATPVLATPTPAANQTNQTAAAPANNTTIKLSSLKEKIAASKARLAGVGGSNDSDQKSAVGSSITSSLNATRERLAATRANLDKQTKNDTSNNTSTSNVPLNSTLNSNNTLNSTLNNTLNKTRIALPMACKKASRACQPKLMASSISPGPGMPGLFFSKPPKGPKRLYHNIRVML